MAETLAGQETEFLIAAAIICHYWSSDHSPGLQVNIVHLDNVSEVCTSRFAAHAYV